MLKFDNDGEGVSVSWNDNSSNENGFRILQNASGSFQEMKEVGANMESATDSSSSLDSRIRLLQVEGFQ